MRVNLVSGSTGAGKTTFARKLAEEKMAVRFSIDEWMNNLYWPDQEPGADYRWAIKRVERCERQIWMSALEVLRCGRDVVFDLGFTEHRQRARFAKLAAEAEAELVTYFVTADTDLRRARVRQRNEEKCETFEFEVTDDMFDFMEGVFEPPTDDEPGKLLIIQT
jgi:predicted kinase